MSTISSPLIALPREIRDQIYTYLFALPATDAYGHALSGHLLLDVSSHIPHSSLGLPYVITNSVPSQSQNANPTSPTSTVPIPFSMLAPLSKTCRLLYWETVPPYLSTVLLSLEDTTATAFLAHWLDSFGPSEAWKNVQHLEFCDFATREYGIDHDFIARCPNLESLSVKLRHTDKLSDFYPRPENPPYPPIVPSPEAYALRDEILAAILAIATPGSPFTEIPASAGTFNTLGHFERLLWKAVAVAEIWDLRAMFELRKLKKIEFGLPDEKDRLLRRRDSRAYPAARLVLSLCLTSWLEGVWDRLGREVRVESEFADWANLEDWIIRG